MTIEDIVVEPEDPSFLNPCAPTIVSNHAEFVPSKHKFNYAFDCPYFQGECELFERARNGGCV